MSVYKTAKSPWWQYDFQIKGHRFHGSLRIPADRPKREAERAEALLRADTERPKTDRERLTLNQATSRYWTESAQDFADAAGEWGRLRNLERLLGKNTFLDELIDADISKYVATRRGENARNKKTKVAPATVNREIECLGRILKRARKPWRARLPEDPIEIGVHKLPERERIRALTTQEDTDLFAATDKVRPDFRDMLEFALLTGKRLSEVILLEKRRVDRKAMEARVIQKGGQEIAIALTPTTLAIIDQNWMHHNQFVFTYICQKSRTVKGVVRRKGQRYPFTPDGWRKPWKEILKQAGIRDFRFHDLRHTAGTRVLAATGNLKAVQDTLSHASITSSARYAHTDSKQRRLALQAAEALRIPEKSRAGRGRKKKFEERAER